LLPCYFDDVIGCTVQPSGVIELSSYRDIYDLLEDSQRMTDPSEQTTDLLEESLNEWVISLLTERLTQLFGEDLLNINSQS